MHTGLSNRRLQLAVSATVLLFASAAIRVDAQAVERGMFVSVVTESGDPVTDLKASEFIIRENGISREVLRVTPATEPLTIALIVDNSEAASDEIPFIRDATKSFMELMGGKNEIALVTVADRPTIAVDYTNDPARLQAGIGRIFAQSGSGTYALQAIIDVSRGIQKRESPRPVMILITTEGPEFSERHYQFVLDALQKSGAALHALVLTSREADLTSDAARDRGVALARGTQLSGGRYANLLSALALPDTLKQVAAELSNQYKVVYARPQSLIQPDKIEVAVTRPKLTARGTPLKSGGTPR